MKTYAFVSDLCVDMIKASRGTQVLLIDTHKDPIKQRSMVDMLNSVWEEYGCEFTIEPHPHGYVITKNSNRPTIFNHIKAWFVRLGRKLCRK